MKCILKYSLCFFLFLLSLYVQAVENKLGNSSQQAMLESGIALLKETSKNNPQKILDYLQPLANAGNSKALIWLGRSYRDGLGGIDKDSKISFNYFRTAASVPNLDSEAQYELGFAYMYGIGTDTNLISAYLWTKLSISDSKNPQQKGLQQLTTLEKKLTSEQLKKANILVGKIRELYMH